MTENNTVTLVLKWGMFNQLHIDIAKAGRPLSAYSSDIPPVFRPLLRQAYNYRSIEDELADVLLQYGKSISIRVQVKSQYLDLSWRPNLYANCFTDLFHQNGDVVIDRALHAENGRVHNAKLLGDRFFVQDDQNLGIIQKSPGWDYWTHVYRYVYLEDEDDKDKKIKQQKMALSLISQPIVVKKKIFSTFQRTHQDELAPLLDAALVRWVEDVETSVSLFESRYDLFVNIPQEESHVSMDVKCLIEQDELPIHHECSAYYITARHLISYFPSHSERQDITKVLYDLIASPSPEAALLAKYADRPGVTQDIKKLRKIVSSLHALDDRQSVFLSSGAARVKVDIGKELRYMLMLASVFGEAGAYDDKHHALTVLKTHFYERFQEFEYWRDLWDLSVTYIGKKVSLRKWDVHIKMKSRDRWFDLHPSIKQAGEAVDGDTLARFMAQQGIVEDADVVMILEDTARDALKQIRDVTDSSAEAALQSGLQIPRLQVLDWLHLRQSGISLNLPDEDAAIFDQLIGDHEIETLTAIPGLKGDLRHYQWEGVSWLTFLYRYRFGACLADDMGLGKTVQAIAFLAWVWQQSDRRYKDAPFLIVVPPSLLFNWQVEIERFYPDFKVELYRGKRDWQDVAGANVVITTYELVRREIETLLTVNFDVVVFDEAQLVKNIRASRTLAARQLKANFKVCLTGTPFENHLGEYFSILDLALPGLMGSMQTFQALVRDNNTSRIMRRSRPFVLRRKKSDILSELPEKTEHDIYLTLSDRQKILYQKIVDEVKSTVSKAFKELSVAQAKVKALTAILRLRQICISPQLVFANEVEVAPKFSYLVTQLHSLEEEGHSALIFSQFTSVLDLLQSLMEAEGLPFIRIDGKTPVQKRRKLVDQFQAGDVPFFLMSLKTGGVGLNLTKASYVFHIDPWWNPNVEEQASDRAHRIGQKQHVQVIRMIMHHTIEEKMMDLKASKRKLFIDMMDHIGSGTQSRKITQADIEYLLE